MFNLSLISTYFNYGKVPYFYIYNNIIKRDNKEYKNTVTV